ncbi:MAG: hypothetical protein KIT27_04260 [Legionellales bacterium]|nr:hypothetical protein [Legionellales bacterium]
MFRVLGHISHSSPQQIEGLSEMGGYLGGTLGFLAGQIVVSQQNNRNPRRR